MTDYSEESDERISASLVTNLEDGFERLVIAYQHRLYGFALRLAGNQQDAEEIAQDAFVRAYRALSTYAPPQTATLRLRPWLFQIALNVFRNRMRLVRPQQVPLDQAGEDGEVLLQLEADRREQPEQMLDSAESERRLAGLIAALPEHFRIAIVLRHIEGLSYAEMAALLGLPTGTLKAHVHRAVKQLQKALDILEYDGSNPSGTGRSACSRKMSEVR
jgi:RNA polymerase sigma-70 factor, ECF subfamily